MLKSGVVVSNFDRPQSESSRGGWRAQFARPRGWAGRLAGHLMAWKNNEQNRFAVEILDPRPDDSVLEVGFGSGRSLRAIAERAKLVVGIDHSEVMLVQAARRNKDLITAGLMQLEQGSVDALPFTYASFDKVLAVNCFHLWPNQELDLFEVQRVMKPGGRIVICQRMNPSSRRRSFIPGISEEELELFAGLLRWVGFQNVRCARRYIDCEIVCLSAER
jgi:ubiquinone/menaquinone biosynthesis C-methylase UbiE